MGADRQCHWLDWRADAQREASWDLSFENFWARRLSVVRIAGSKQAHGEQTRTGRTDMTVLKEGRIVLCTAFYGAFYGDLARGSCANLSFLEPPSV